MDVRLEGETLVAANGTSFPDVCLKCGVRHGIERRHQKFQFVPMWARFFGPLFQVMFMKKSEFYLPLCTACHAQWKKWNWIAGLSWLPFFFLMFLGIAIGDSAGGGIATIGMLGMFAALIVTLILRLKHIVAVTKIDATHSWMTKINPTALQTIMNPQAAMAQAPMQVQQYGYQQPYAAQ